MNKLIIVFLLFILLIAYAVSGAFHVAGASSPLARATWTPAPPTRTHTPVTPLPTSAPAYPGPAEKHSATPVPARGLQCRSC